MKAYDKYMNKEIRNCLCPKCLKAVRGLEAKYLKRYRLKIKVVAEQEKGKVKIKQIK